MRISLDGRIRDMSTNDNLVKVGHPDSQCRAAVGIARCYGVAVERGYCETHAQQYHDRGPLAGKYSWTVRVVR